MQTSLSDKPSYRSTCRRAVKDNEFFNEFKKHAAYTEILEHTNPELGQQYLDLLPKDFNFGAGRLNDRLGGPQLIYYPNIGKISPSSLRYLSVAYNIEKLFGSTNVFKIAEIGAGYGGFALILEKLYGWGSYEFYDLKEPLLLIEKYLNLNGIHMDLCGFNDAEHYIHFNKEEYDLVISNYAFSELSRKIQDSYLDKVLLPAKRGYLTMNFISRGGGIYSYSKDEILEKLASKNPKVLPEIPLTSEENCVMVWGQND